MLCQLRSNPSADIDEFIGPLLDRARLLRLIFDLVSLKESLANKPPENSGQSQADYPPVTEI